jgi:ribosome modulation factor
MRQIPAISKDLRDAVERSIVRKGYEAGTNGVGIMCNPYAAGSKAYRAWRDGFHMAYGYSPVRGSPLDVGPL